MLYAEDGFSFYAILTHMSMRFLHIKRAYVTDSALSQEVERDIVSNTLLLQNIYEGSMHDVCAITEDGEWLIAGRKIDPTSLLNLYPSVFVYIHSPSKAYDQVDLLCKAHSQHYVSVYKATDAMVHHTERLATLIKTQQIKAKIPHEVHVDMKSFNDEFISSEHVAGKHIRNVFLPVHVVPSLYRNHVPRIHASKLAHTHEELSEHIDDLRHTNSHLTLREHVKGDSVYMISIPHFRKQDIYITMPVATKDVSGLIHFQESVALGKAQKEEAHQVVSDIARVLFSKSSVVYKLKVHGKRGVFVEATMPAYFFILHNHDFLFAVASSHGIQPRELLEKLM